MNLRVMSWNAEGMFVEGSMTRRASPDDALAVLREVGADVVVVPEFGVFERMSEKTSSAIAALGYTMEQFVYGDERGRGTGLAILSRLPIESRQRIAMNEFKSALEVVVAREHQNIRIIGVHLDDRTEAGRLAETEQLVAHIGSRKPLPTLMMGDFNAMDGSTFFARIARGICGDIAVQIVRNEQLSSVVSRVREMALGTTIRYIESQTHLRNLDPKFRRTISAKQRGLEWLPAFRLAKIDWVFGSPEVAVKRYRVLRDVGSDHRPIVVDIEIAPSKE